MKKILTLLCLATAFHVSVFSQEFIVNKHNYHSQIASTTCSATILNSKLYIAFQPQGTTQVRILVFSDASGATLVNQFTSPGDGYKYPWIAAQDGSLYVAFTGADTHLNIVKVQVDGNGYPKALVDKRTSGESSDVGSVLSSTPTGLIITWQGKNAGASQVNVGSVK